jgi:hypothetical protein
MSVIAPKEKDDIEVQFDHSQIYLYELDANKIPSKRPRHCLPYAVVTWVKFDDGTEWPMNFNELEIVNNNHNGEKINGNGLNNHSDAEHEQVVADGLVIKAELVTNSEVVKTNGVNHAENELADTVKSENIYLK